MVQLEIMKLLILRNQKHVLLSWETLSSYYINRDVFVVISN